MSWFSELLAEKNPVESDTVQVMVKDRLVSFKFYELAGTEWASITTRNPPRLNHPVDVRFGYNVHAVCSQAAPQSGFLLDGDTETKLQVTDEVNEWEALFSILSGPDFAAICDAIFGLNQWNPEQRTEKAKKASAAGSKQKLVSPAKSASAPSASTGGNRAARRRTTTPTTK